jgi:hypothetical protein
MPYVTGHVQERTFGESVLSDNYLIGTFQLLKREVFCLFPFGYGGAGAVAGVFLVMIAASFCYVFRKKNPGTGKVRLYLLIGLIPLIRFLVMRNHTAMHAAFTFRALSGTVLALLLAMASVAELPLPGKGSGRGKKK